MNRHNIGGVALAATLCAFATVGCGGGSAPTDTTKLSGRLAYTEVSADGLNFEIFTQNADGTARAQLTDDPAFDSGPALSPDGRTVAFFSDREGTGLNVYAIGVDGSGLKRLTSSSVNDLGVAGGSDPAWSADSKKIVYRAVNTRGGTSICTMNADGSEGKRLTEAAGQDDKSPEFSPDGTRIVFSTNAGTGAQIFVMNSDGTNVRQLTSSGSATQNARNGNPTFSPSGAQILYTTGQDRVLDDAGDLAFEIYKMNADGSGQTRLTNDANDDIDPVWSPDGTKILFASTGGATGGIFVMSADGSGRVKVNDTFGLQLSWR